ncbi:MAG: YidC/Oxa1 family membrane protein insertase [Acutalibacteraceae bacterium]|nr:YidC/Oxa1 family membrane protein insertase [Acutalibacteraceae bacterium]
MTKIFEILNTWIFAPVLRFFMELTGGNYALSIFLFTLAINIILIPLSIKSQKASVSQLKIKPKLDELKKKYGDDKQKYNEAMQKLYQEGNVSMGGGCLPMIVRLVLVMSVFYLVTSPLTYLTSISADEISAAVEALGDNARASYKQLAVIAEATSGNTAFAAIKEAISGIDFDFLGLDLTLKPSFSLNFSKVTAQQLKLWIIPFLSFAAAMFSSIISMAQQKRTNPDAPSMAGMMLTMPIMSLIISFSAPAGLGFYWACSSFIGAFIQIFVQECFGPRKAIAGEQKKLILKKADEENKFLKLKTK